jgi:hypothetical protein
MQHTPCANQVPARAESTDQVCAYVATHCKHNPLKLGFFVTFEFSFMFVSSIYIAFLFIFVLYYYYYNLLECFCIRGRHQLELVKQNLQKGSQQKSQPSPAVIL